ncbi:MAG: hypothetical protein HON29_01230, partial [Candidatus Magasanikbacteria bacterium]|nr:hypothetical protein [Candidatus Magasanikbacteria bacterium]
TLEQIWRHRKQRWQQDKENTEVREKETKKELKKILRTRYGVSPGDTQYIGIPYNPSEQQQRTMKQVITKEWEKAYQTTPNFITKTIKKRFHIKKNPTIGEILINMRKYAKNHGEKPTCMCKHEVFKGTKRTKGHLAIRASEIQNKEYKDIRNIHFQTVPRPATIHVIKDTTETIRDMLRKIQKKNPIENTQWKKTERRINKKLRQKIFIKTNDQCKSTVPTRRRVIQIKKKLQGLVITNMDRHRGEISIECPCRYYANLKKMFDNEDDAGKTEKEVKKQIKENYKWQHIVRLKESGEIPGPVYNLNKEKDITRQRPVRPSFRTRNKTLLSITARVINFWINKATLKTRNWHIDNVLKIKTHWQREKTRISIYGKNTRFLFKPGDIKDFFTTCEHTEALQAVKYLRQRYKKKTNLYKVRKRGRNGVTNTTRGTLGDRRYTIISGDEVMDILQYALENQYYKLGKKIKQQKIGFPMGEAVAPPGANSIAATAMEQWADQNPTEFQRTTILRFVDDMISVVAYDKTNKETLETGKKILDELYTNKRNNKKGVFKTPIRIIDEPVNKDGSSNFLEVEINTTKKCDDLTIRYKYKNEEHFKHGEKRKLKLIVPYESWGPTERHQAKIVGKFLRMEILTGQRQHKKDKRLTHAVIPYIEECLENGYPPQTILKSINKMEGHDHQWKTIKKKITMAMYPHHPYGIRLGRPKFPKEKNLGTTTRTRLERCKPDIRNKILRYQWQLLNKPNGNE